MTRPATDSRPPRPDAGLHFHALFLDTQLDLVWSPGLGRRIRACVARLATGRGPTPRPDLQDRVPAQQPEKKGAAR